MSRTRQVLLTAVDAHLENKAIEPLRDKGWQVRSVPWDDAAGDLVTTTAFDAIVIGFPVAGVALGRFLSAVRALESPCRRCGVVLLARPDAERQARQFVGHGVNRVVATSDLPLRLVRTVAELLRVAPRVELRLPTRIMLRLEDRPSQALCQTENVSVSGMLVRGFDNYPKGTSFDFEISLPDDDDPLRGVGEVCRTANVARENVRGFGARFTSFAETDLERLEELLDREKN
jgi:hypothetical protein